MSHLRHGSSEIWSPRFWVARRRELRPLPKVQRPPFGESGQRRLRAYAPEAFHLGTMLCTSRGGQITAAASKKRLPLSPREHKANEMASSESPWLSTVSLV